MEHSPRIPLPSFSLSFLFLSHFFCQVLVAIAFHGAIDFDFASCDKKAIIHEQSFLREMDVRRSRRRKRRKRNTEESRGGKEDGAEEDKERERE